MKIILGIDPGLSGAIAAVQGQKLVSVFDMPIVERKVGKSVKRFVAPHELHTELAAFLIDHECECFIEQVSAMPGQGVTSMFTFGMGFGGLQAVLCTLDSPFALVRPQVWQSAVFKGLDKKLGKARSIIYCQQRWPDQGKLKDGPADALCVAIYARSLKNSGIIDSRY